MGRTIEQCDDENERLVKQMLDLFPLLEVTVEYQVRVIDEAEEGMCRGRGEEGQLRTLRATINIIDEALKLLTNYFQMKTPFTFMRLSRDSCRLIFLVSMAMAEFFEEFKHRESFGAEHSELEKFMASTGLLVEGDMTKNGILNNQVLSITQAQYKEMHMGDDTEATPSGPAVTSVTNMGDIQLETEDDEFDTVVHDL